MATPWVESISYIIDGEAVKAKTPNRPLQQLGQRTKYLYEALQEASIGEVIISRNVKLATNTVPGTPVYFNPANARYEPGKADVTLTGNNYGFAANTTYIQGIVLSKSTSNTGDIALVGRIRQNEDAPIDWSAVIDDGDLVSGPYFLSAIEGKITRSRSHVSAFVGVLDALGNMDFNPAVNGSLRDHLHYRFDLENSIGATLSDDGWIPVAEFEAVDIPVPAGAIYGYNVANDADLAANFPPVPAQAHAFYREGLLLENDGTIYVLDENGLWWISGTGPTGSIGLPAVLTLWITSLDTNQSEVTSLDPNTTDSDTQVPITFRNSAGEIARTGALLAALEEFFPISEMDNNGALALKSVEGIQTKFGPVLARLIPGQNVSIEADEGDATNGYYGVVRVSVGTTGDLIGQPTLAALNNAQETFFKQLPVVSFPVGRASSVQYVVAVPTNVRAGSKLRLVLDFLGPSNQAGVGLNVGYTRVQDGVDVPNADTALTALSFTLTTNRKVTVETDKVDVNPGDIVYFTLTQPSTLAYSIPVARALFAISRT